MSISASGMIDRASAEISKCIMRIKRKETKKPPEVPPKPTGNGGASSSSSAGIPILGSSMQQSTACFNNADMIRNGMVAVLPSSSPSPRGYLISGSPSGTSTSGSSGIGNTTPLTPRKFVISSNKKNSLTGGPIVGLVKATPGGIGTGTPVTSGLGRFSRTSSTGNGNGAGAGVQQVVSTPEQLWQNDEFLKYLFLQFFSGSEKLVLPCVCKKWRDVCYNQPQFWNSDLIPVLKCKELRRLTQNNNVITATRPNGSGNGNGLNNNCLNIHTNGGSGSTNGKKGNEQNGTGAGFRRRFYAGLVKRGFNSLRMDSATDEDAEDVIIHFSQGTQLIQSLKITSSSLTDKGIFNLLDHLSSLRELELSSCNELTEDGIVSALPKKLEKLTIYDCIHVADLVVSFVAKTLPYLCEFSLQAYHVTDSALMAFNQKTNSKLIKLKLDSCWELTNQTVLHIVSGLSTLTHLSLSGCSKITDEGVEILAENLTHLRALDLSWGPRISDTSLECIACDLVCLEELILDRCTLITDLGVGYLATMSTLKKLSLRWCTIRDVSVHHIVGMRKLQFLSLAGCVNISPSTLCSLSTLRSLKELELTNCGATYQVLQFLKNTLNCVIIE